MQKRKRIAIQLSVLGVLIAMLALGYMLTPPPHRTGQWRSLIDHAQMLQADLKISSGTWEAPVDWDWRATVRHVEGPTAEEMIRGIDGRGIVVDSSQDIREAGGVFAVVGSEHIVVFRHDKQLVVLEKETFYSSADKRSLLQKAEPW